MLKMQLKFGDKLLRTIESEKQELLIGRSPESDICIDNLGVSGRHARIFEKDGHYMIEDLDSTNGTFVNEKRITSVLLQAGSNVVIGKHNLLVQEAVPGSRRKPAQTEKTMKLETRSYKEMLKKQ